MSDFVQFLTVLLSLSDFGVGPNPKAPAAPEVTRYGAEGAELFIYVDVEAVLPRNHRALMKLPVSPALKDAPDMREAIQGAVAQVEAARMKFAETTGIDPVKDVRSVAVWLDLDGGEPSGLMAVRGAFPADWSDRVRHLAGEYREVDGRTMVRIGDAAAGVTADGQLLLGTPALVEPRLGKRWRPVAAPAGSAGAVARQALAVRPIATAVLVPSAAMTEMVRSATDGEKIPAAFIAGQKHSAWSVHHDGVSWTYAARDADGYRTALLASEAALDLMRAGHLFGRGVARAIMAGLRAQAGDEPEVQALLAREKEILQLVERVTGDGRFKATVGRQAARRTVSVRARGRSLSEVVPLAGVLPLAGAGAWLTFARAPAPPERFEESSAPAAAPAPTPAPAAKRPLDVRGVYRRALERRAAP